MKEPTVSISAYTRGAVVTPQDLADDEIQLTVDQAQAFAFKVDDIEERQSHVNFEALATSSGAFSLKRNYDKNVLQAMIDGAGIKGASGSVETDSNLGTSGTPHTMAGSDAGDEAVQIIALMARHLDQADVPEENRWFVAPPRFYETLYKAGAKIAEVQVTGDDQSPMRNGMLTAQKVMGFTLYKSMPFVSLLMRLRRRTWYHSVALLPERTLFLPVTCRQRPLLTPLLRLKLSAILIHLLMWFVVCTYMAVRSFVQKAWSLALLITHKGGMNYGYL